MFRVPGFIDTLLFTYPSCRAKQEYIILGDPGADREDEGKPERAGKCGAKKSKERRSLLYIFPPIQTFPDFICPWVSEDGNT